MKGSLSLSTGLYESVCVYPSKRMNVVTCGTNGTTFGTHMQIHLEMVVYQIIISRVTYGAFGGV